MIGYLLDEDVVEIRENCEAIFNSPVMLGEFTFCKLVKERASCDKCYYRFFLREECPFLSTSDYSVENHHYIAWKIWEFLKHRARVLVVKSAPLDEIEPGFHVYLHDYLGAENGLYRVLSKDGKSLILKADGDNRYYSLKATYNEYCFYHKAPSIIPHTANFQPQYVSKGDFLFIAPNPRIPSGFYEVVKKTRQLIHINVNDRVYPFTNIGSFVDDFDQYLFFSERDAELGNYVTFIGDSRMIARNIFVSLNNNDIAFGKWCDVLKEIATEVISGYEHFGTMTIRDGRRDFIKTR